MNDLKEAVRLRQEVIEYQDQVYLNLIQQANTKYADIIKDDLGSQFVISCGRDLAGELVRTYFDTSDFHITVDQLASRILDFQYEHEYDPLASNGDVQKLAYNLNDPSSSDKIKQIVRDMDQSQKKLFEKENHEYKDQKMITRAKLKYVQEHTNADGTITDEYTGRNGEYITGKDGNHTRRQEADHTQALNTARYNSKYITEKGAERLREFYNSSENFAMMDKSANSSKGDVKVKPDGKDITHRATPEEYMQAIVNNWEKDNGNSNKIENLKAKGYLDENGKVPKAVKAQLVKNIKASQNAESMVILKETDYGHVVADAGKKVTQSIGKMIAGQVIYYVMPPLLYELRNILKKKSATLEEALEHFNKSKGTLVSYIQSKLSTIFKNFSMNLLKNFIKTFLDILINTVKATVKKIIKLAKNLVLSTVDAIKIICDKTKNRSEKADAVVQLFGVTITTFVVELLSEYVQRQIPIPEFLLLPIQTITTILCTNLTMLILQKADLFNVRHGFKIQAIKQLFEENRQAYTITVEQADLEATDEINQIIANAREETLELYHNLMHNDPYDYSVSYELEKINKMFRMNVSFGETWETFIGMRLPVIDVKRLA